jgi:hypothetical protein
VTPAAVTPNGHVRGLTPGMTLLDRYVDTELLHLADRGRPTIRRSVRFGHVRGLTPGMSERASSEGDGA